MYKLFKEYLPDWVCSKKAGPCSYMVLHGVESINGHLAGELDQLYKECFVSVSKGRIKELYYPIFNTKKEAMEQAIHDRVRGGFVLVLKGSPEEATKQIQTGNLSKTILYATLYADEMVLWRGTNPQFKPEKLFPPSQIPTKKFS